MNYEKAMDFLFSPKIMAVKKKDMARIRNILDKLGNPQRDLKFVHIAGTNGKGSVSAMISTVLRSAGYKTGLFISPSLQSYNERISVDGENISDDKFANLISRLKDVFSSLAPEALPSHFEMLTICALLYYKEEDCDIVVFEVGLGGEFDATNCIDMAEVSVITPIAIDHTKILGNSFAEIAVAKAGIIKQGGRLVYAPQEEEAREVILKKVKEMGASAASFDSSKIRIISSSLKGQVISLPGFENLKLSLLGMHQAGNAALALLAILKLRERGFIIPDECIREGFASTIWPGRFELVAKSPITILDGAHNPHGVKFLRQSLEEYFPQKKIVFMIGILEDKGHEKMLEEVLPLAQKIVTVTPNSHRAIAAKTLAGFIHDHSDVQLSTANGVKEGLDDIMASAEKDDIVCIFGSLYVVAEVREYFGLYKDN